MKKSRKRSAIRQKSKRHEKKKNVKASAKSKRVRKIQKRSKVGKKRKEVLSGTRKKVRVKQVKNNEQIIAELRAKGKTLKDIAKRTGVSQKDLRKYRDYFIRGKKPKGDEKYKVFDKKLKKLAEKNKITKDWNITVFQGERIGADKIKFPKTKYPKGTKYIHAIMTVKFTTTKGNSFTQIISQVFKPSEGGPKQLQDYTVEFFNSRSQAPYIAKIELVDFHINFVEKWYTEK